MGDDDPRRQAASGGAAAPPRADDTVDRGRRAAAAWLWRVPVILALGGGAYGVYEAYRVHFDKKRPDPTPDFAPVAATEVAALDAFAREWDAVPFELPAPAGTRAADGRASLPALAVRLPGPIPGGLAVPPEGGRTAAVHLAGFSRLCTHQGCVVELNTDLAAIDFGFNYGTAHPALTCPCHLSVFDPTRAGRAVSGPAVRPLPRVALRADAGRLWAVGLERG